MAYKFQEDIATADISVKATGKDLTELFQSMADAFVKICAEPESVKPEIKKEVRLEHTDIEKLMFNFLEELVFMKDAEPMVFNEIEVKVTKGNIFQLHAELIGDSIKPGKQILNMDVKAVTLHRFFVKKTKHGWETEVIFDI